MPRACLIFCIFLSFAVFTSAIAQTSSSSGSALGTLVSAASASPTPTPTPPPRPTTTPTPTPTPSPAPGGGSTGTQPPNQTGQPSMVACAINPLLDAKGKSWLDQAKDCKNAANDSDNDAQNPTAGFGDTLYLKVSLTNGKLYN